MSDTPSNFNDPNEDPDAHARLHRELRAIARAVLKDRPCPGLLQTTALVHEAWMRLRGFDLSRIDSSSSQFAALAAKTLRSVLVDEARRELRIKRGGNWHRLPIPTADIESRKPLDSVDLLCLDEAMQELAAINAREATVVELRFFGGLTIDQVAEHMGFSKRTIESDWEHARAWLRVRLDGMTRRG
ncbi:MAG: ECF-type sigma factor [Phycisphaerales bacterium]|nr:sigma-70 family RNA polymerase sigma factor [Planctomycetota bacterium]